MPRSTNIETDNIGPGNWQNAFEIGRQTLGVFDDSLIELRRNFADLRNGLPHRINHFFHLLFRASPSLA